MANNKVSPGGHRKSMMSGRFIPKRSSSASGGGSVDRQDSDMNLEFSPSEQKSALVIQRSFRCMIARAEMVHRKERIKIYGIGDKKSGVKLPRNTVELNWRGVTSRFVKYVSDHYWESGQEGDVCVLILDIWYNHLVKARTYFIDINGVQLPESQLHLAKSLKFIEPRDLAPHERELYHQKQSQLNELGVTVLLSHLISNLANNLKAGGLPSLAIKLFTELLNAGNSDVQECLFTHLVEGDDEGKLLLYLEGRLTRGFEAMADAKKRGVIGSGNEAMMEDIQESYELLMQTTRFLQLLCEGHHLGFQDYMRTQPMHTASHVNLVRVVANIVVLLCDSTYIVSRFTSMEVSLVSQLLRFLIVCMQGPCTGNQDLIGKSDVVASMNSIICAKIPKDEENSANDPHYVNLKGLSCILLASMLEAREDQTIHEQLFRKLEIASFEEYRIALETRIYEILNLIKTEQRPRTKDEITEIQTKASAVVALWTVLIEINFKPASALRVENQEQLVGLVEIAWRGKVQRTCFALPFEMKFLTNTTKQKFMEEVDLSTAEKRMADLIAQTDLFISEMDIIFAKAETSKAYKYLYNNLRYFKLANYGLVFALNLNILLSPASLGSPSAIIAKEISGRDGHSDNPITRLEIYSVVVTTVLGALVTIGYAVIISTLAVTEIPLLIQELDADAKRHEPPTRHDIMMFWTPSLFGFCATFLFVFLHLLNNDPALGLYLAIIIILNVPLGFRAYRKTIGIAPTNKYLRYFAITYDVLFKRSFLRNHLVLMLFCFLGYFVNVEFFTLELLDVVAISPVIADIIRSVTSPGFALGLVFYLFVITVIIYAAFGMNHFASSLLVPLEDGNIVYEEKCGSMLQCFYFIFHQGLSESGNMNQFLATNFAGDNSYPMRVMYDSVFFVWVGIVLVNIITGLMVDTFSSIREEKQSRADSLNTICFVCGTLRRSYDDMDFSLAPEAPKFDTHIALEHDPWTYVFYLAYLKKKGSEDDSGIETFVRDEISRKSLSWIPSRTSYFIEAAKSKNNIQASKH